MKIAIIGAGKLGIRITEALLDGDYDITVVDNNEKKLDMLAQQFDVFTVLGDAKTIETLNKIDVKSFDFLIATTTSDDTNILTASFAKILGCKRVIARVREPEHMNQLDFLREHYNIDMLINPDLLITSEIYRYLVEKYTLSNGIFTSRSIALIEFEADKKPQLIGKSLVEFRTIMPDMLMVGISRKGKMIIPHGNSVIEAHDLLYLIGEKENVFDLASRVHTKMKHSSVQKVMIIGGGKTGYYLASRLSEYGVFVKIIEKDKERCHYLANKLENVMVLNGDGSNVGLLNEEDMDEMDAFVTATGYDEENLLLALMAKTHGIEDVISKVSHDSYTDLISKLGIDVVLNPLDISCSTVLRLIRGAKKVISSVLLQGQAELMEVYAQEGMSMINIPLKNMNLPDYIIIAAIHRGMETIIPDGNTKIKPGDRVTIVCMISNIGYVEKLFKPNIRLNILK
ncbi:quinate 5-dehydrogenase [Mogibacterium pumilum]|uniref:Trk system potassium uptake protein TrkA n=2 Tax=Mogibacterium pumilum TaxID=86332 RepID=A0A223ASZ2_9FIRM|nr:quinate 5-dehydrogenase [Mogibacterium pumilum]